MFFDNFFLAHVVQNEFDFVTVGKGQLYGKIFPEGGEFEFEVGEV